MRSRKPLEGRNRNPKPFMPVEAETFREVALSESEYIDREGAVQQSVDYDGTEVSAADATTGYRLESTGAFEAQDARIRGDLVANDFVGLGPTLIHSSDGFEVSTEGWTATGATLARVTTGDVHSGVASLEATATATTYTLRSDAIAMPQATTTDRLFNLRLAMKNADGHFGIVEVEYYSAVHGLLATEQLAYFPLSTSWHETNVGGWHWSTAISASVSYVKLKISASSGVAIGETLRIDRYSIYRHSSISAATFAVGNDQLGADGGVQIDPSVIRLTPPLGALGGTTPLYGEGLVYASASRGVATVRPYTAITSPTLDDGSSPDGADIALYGNQEGGSGPTSIIELNAQAVRVGGSTGSDTRILRFGTELSKTTDASGYYTFAHGLGATPIVVQLTACGPISGAGIVGTILWDRAATGSTNIRVRCFDLAGAAINAGSVSFAWEARV